MDEEPSIYMQMGKRCKELSTWNNDKNKEVAYQKAGAYDELKLWLDKIRILEEKYYKLRYGEKLQKEITNSQSNEKGGENGEARK